MISAHDKLKTKGYNGSELKKKNHHNNSDKLLRLLTSFLSAYIMEKSKKHNRNPIIKGAIVIFAAAFIWGIGNFVTGFTARKYLESGSLFPAIDIALANTIGGILFVYLLYNLSRFFVVSQDRGKKTKVFVGNNFAILSGILKGMNTCLFVFATTYIAATQALIFENTYILWSLLFVIILSNNSSFLPISIQALVLCVGVFLISDQGIQFDNNTEYVTGVTFGLGAGISYALFLRFWSNITKQLDHLQLQALGTLYLLIISFLSILVFTQAYSLLFLKSFWMPFTSLIGIDICLQLVNGIFVVGVTYLLITVGMSLLKDSKEGANFITALGLSFAMPFTLLPELIIGKFIPSLIQMFGIIFFMIGFILMSMSLEKTKK